MQDYSITRLIALVNIAMLGPAIWELERDWGTAITPLEVVILSAIILAGLVAIYHIREI